VTNTLIILAGGASSRMKNSVDPQLSEEKSYQANHRSKGLIEIHGKPFLYYLINNASKAGFESIYIITGEDASQFRSALSNQTDLKTLDIQFATQYIPSERVKPYGTADAVYQCLEQYPELKNKTFCVCNSDNLYTTQAFELLKKAPSNQAILAYDIDALEYPIEKISRFAVMKFNEQYDLLDIIEKPDPSVISNYTDASGKTRVSMNIFLFDGNIFFDYLKNCQPHPERNEKELPTALKNMIKDGKVVLGIPIATHVPDLTAKGDITILEQYLDQN
jgi:dTDP-glucose pyrophosphorylase